MTPEEIVGLIDNIVNRKDIRDVQTQQIEEIYQLVKEFEDIAIEWKRGYEDLKRDSKIKISGLEQIIEELEKELDEFGAGKVY